MLNSLNNISFHLFTCLISLFNQALSLIAADAANKAGRPALFAASAAIRDSAWLNKEIKHVNKWNEILFKEFNKMKIIKNKSFTNFILINFDKLKIKSHKVFQLLANSGILVRKMDVYGIKNSLRVTIGKSMENKKLIFRMRRILNV